MKSTPIPEPNSDGHSLPFAPPNGCEDQIEEPDCLYLVSELLHQAGMSIDELLHRVVDVIHVAYHPPELVCARITLGNRVFVSGHFGKTSYAQARDIMLQRERIGRVEVFYAESNTAIDEAYLSAESGDPLGDIAAQISAAVARTQPALWESEQIFRLAFDRLPVGAAIISLEHRIQRANDALCRLIGCSAEELAKPALADLINVEDLEPGLRDSRFLVTGGEDKWCKKLRFTRKDGQVRTVDFTLVLVRDAEGQPLYFLGVVEQGGGKRQWEEIRRDITGQTQAGLDSIGVARFILDDNLTVMNLNRAAEDFLCKEAKDVVERALFEVIPEAKESMFEDMYARAVQDKIPVSFEHQFGENPQGDWYNVLVYPENNHTAVCLRLITGWKHAEERGRIGERRLRKLVRTMREGIWHIDTDGNTKFVNERTADMLRCTPGSMLGENLLSFVDRADVKAARTYLRRLGHGGRSRGNFEFCRKDGSRLFASLEAAPIFDEEGSYAGSILGVQNLIARVEKEQKLRQLEEQYREVVEEVNDIVLAVDLDGTITHLDPDAERLTGWAPSDVIGQPIFSFLAPADVIAIRDSMRQALAGKTISPTECRLSTANGDVIWTLASGEPIRSDSQISGWRGVLSVITEQKEKERKSQEQGAVAEREWLARELHDSVTQSLSAATQMADALPEILMKHPEEARKGLEELRSVTAGALAETRALLGDLRPEGTANVPLAALVSDLTKAMRNRTRAILTATTVGDSVLPSPVQLAFYRIAQEALNNIAKHAKAREGAVSLFVEADKVRLSIIDNGCGFESEAVQAKQFGLRIMQERAEGIGAVIRIESHLGRGTEIEVNWHQVRNKTGEEKRGIDG